MKKISSFRLIILGFFGSFICNNLIAQETFDLSSQRSENQNVLSVPGKKLNHNGLIVNPVPHEMKIGEDFCDLTNGVSFKGKYEKFASSLAFVKNNKKGVRLSIDYGQKISGKNSVKPVSGAYRLSIGKKGISIVGYDERGAFYGIQTLIQIFDSPVGKSMKLPYVDINDYPDLPNRGVVEGFYGTPWSHEVRLSLIDFYGKFKMNSYLYGPKDDPYHSCPNWRKPYPDKEAQNIKDLVEACNRNYVDFIWAIHPGQDIKWNEEDYNNLVQKFNWMYDLGVRHFAIFFDDISGEGTNPLKQTELLNRLTDDFVKEKGDVSPLTICPTDYSKLWANPTEKGSLAIYGKTLYPDIKVFWTGDVVCSDMTPETMEFINSRIKRPAYYWWNYPVTDYVRNMLLQGPVYGLDTSLTANGVCGVVSNPMEHGEASKLALYSVSDYTWNVSGYNAIDSWERGLEYLVPNASDAYRTFAIHSCDTENGYRRDESWETTTFRLNGWSDELADALEKEFIKVEKTPDVLEKSCDNALLMTELKPWLDEFKKLGARGKRAIEIARIFRSGESDSLFWENYTSNLMSPEDMKKYQDHKSGTMKLQPFYENIMDDMAHEFLKRISGITPYDYKGIGSFPNSNTISTKLMLDNDSTTFYTSGFAQKDGDWIGIDLRDVRDVNDIFILQGRNSKDDVDYFDHVVLQSSADGKTWKDLTGALKKQYVIKWHAEPHKARYVRLKRLDSEKKNYASVRSFEVNAVTPENLGFNIQAECADKAVFAFDNNPATSYLSEKSLSFDILEDARSYVLLMNKLESPLRCIQVDKKGNVVSEETITSSYAEIKIAGSEVSKITLEGNVELFEIVPVKK